MKIIVSSTEKLVFKVITYIYVKLTFRDIHLNDITVNDPPFMILVDVYILGTHIFPLYGNQSCHEDPMAKLKRELEKAKEEIREYERNKIKVPSK